MINLIIGLGNPNPEYANTYHNVGHLFIDHLLKIENLKLKIIKSEVYMNKSGSFVSKTLKKYNAQPEELLIVHDDSDIELGKYKLSFGRGSAGHHGIESIQTTLKTKDFWRLRIGIRPINPIGPVNRRPKAGDFVLKKISSENKKILEKVFQEIIKKIKEEE